MMSNADIMELVGSEFFARVKIGFWDKADLDEAVRARDGGY